MFQKTSGWPARLASALPGLAGLLIFGTANAQLGEHRNEDLNTLAHWLEGHFDNSQQLLDDERRGAGADASHNRIDMVFARVSLPQFGPVVFFSQQYSGGDPARIFRQAIYSIVPNADGRRYDMTIHLLLDHEKYRDAHLDATRLKNIDSDDMKTLPPECVFHWERRIDQFYGEISKGDCKIVSPRSGNELTLLDEFYLRNGELWFKDQGTDHEGNHAYGNRAGIPYKLKKISPPKNSNIVREARGVYAYRTLRDKTHRGSEYFKLFVHPDGSRTMNIWHDLHAKDAQFTVVLRVAADFRPLSAFVSYWVESGYKGNSTFRIQGNTLTTSTIGPAGSQTRSVEVPEHFSIGTHPVAADGWHQWYVDPELGSAGALNLFSVEASADLEKPILGQLVQMPYEVIGNEVISTPAGTFETVHYRLMGSSDVWITGEDRLLVRMTMERFDREYLLMDFESR
ncbi:MAG: CpcT/CpeT family chromophore lyase [Gammaproteobacteria bacterium]|nr:CpcT/CpeT family chromophore lyase [Gammaproteobacteria bacterium]